MNLKILFAFAIVVLPGIFFCVSGNAFAQKPSEKAINNYIKKEAKAQQADEYEKARKILFGDLDGDDDRDAVVQYTLEGFQGGNNWSQFLAVFRNDRGIYKFAADEVVGGKLSARTFVLQRIINRKILVLTESCPDLPQGICENPKKGKATFVFRRGKLLEQ